MRGSLILFCLLLSLSHLEVTAQTGPRVLRVPGSTRALGLADVHPAGSVDSDAIFYHAAFDDRLRGASIAAQRYGGEGTLYTASAGIDWWGGALALGLRTLEDERAASLAFARRVKGVRGSITGHVVEQRAGAERNTTFAADIATGFMIRAVALAIAARNIGPGYELAGIDMDLPTVLAATAALTNPLTPGPLDVLPVAALTWEVHGEVIPAAGVEVSYWPISGRTFSLRVGARRAPEGTRPFTLGGGFTGDRLILDYALVPFDDDRFAHRFGVRWR